MELKDYIEQGAKKQGSLSALGRYLGQSEGAIRGAKSQARGLPVYACLRLAEYINADPLQVIVSSELVTEKREERRKIFQHFLTKNNAQNVMLCALFLMILAYDVRDSLICLI
jgi:hypothetical protein